MSAMYPLIQRVETKTCLKTPKVSSIHKRFLNVKVTMSSVPTLLKSKESKVLKTTQEKCLIKDLELIVVKSWLCLAMLK